MILTFILFLLVTSIGEVAGVETFVMAILGAFGTFIVQAIKQYSGSSTIQDTKALNLTVVVSAVLAIIGAFVTNAFVDYEGGVTVGSVINGAFVVFGVATLAYKYLLSKDAPVDFPEAPAV